MIPIKPARSSIWSLIDRSRPITIVLDGKGGCGKSHIASIKMTNLDPHGRHMRTRSGRPVKPKPHYKQRRS